MKQLEEVPDKTRPRAKTILIADDNAEIRKLLCEEFMRDGFTRCGEADNGKDAIDLARQLCPDIVILDLSMPVMNGLEAAPEIRKISPNVHIILYTLYASTILETQLAAMGIDRVFSKSESVSGLVRQAHELMSR